MEERSEAIQEKINIECTNLIKTKINEMINKGRTNGIIPIELINDKYYNIYDIIDKLQEELDCYVNLVTEIFDLDRDGIYFDIYQK